MRIDATFHYRITYRWNIDGLSNLEYEEFFTSFFTSYLSNCDDSNYDYDWEISDWIYREFVIPEKFMTGILAGPWRIWTKLHERRTATTVDTARHLCGEHENAYLEATRQALGATKV